jgi:hypothetical protein
MRFDDETFGLRLIQKYTEQFQCLFPYALFLSPAYVEKERRCSICDAVASLRSSCEHDLGEIYDGVMCLHRITMAELIEISFVTEPVQKYSVLFMKNPKTGQQVDHYDYFAVSYVVKALANPFHGWSIERTTMRHPHSRYRHVGRNSACPCGSGDKYKACCLREEGVLRPHMNFRFDEAPATSLGDVQYSRSV